MRQQIYRCFCFVWPKNLYRRVGECSGRYRWLGTNHRRASYASLSHATSVLQHASAVHFKLWTKVVQAPAFVHSTYPTGRVRSLSCTAELQQVKPINSCGKLI